MPRKFTKKTEKPKTEKKAATKKEPKKEVATPKSTEIAPTPESKDTPQPTLSQPEISQSQEATPSQPVAPQVEETPSLPTPTPPVTPPVVNLVQSTPSPSEAPESEPTQPSPTTQTAQPAPAMPELNTTQPETPEPQQPTETPAQPSLNEPSTIPVLQTEATQQASTQTEKSGTIDVHPENPVAGQVVSTAPASTNSQPENTQMNNTQQNQFGLNLLDDEPKKKSSKLLYIIGALIIIGAIGYTVYDFFGMGKSNNIVSSSIPTPTVESTPVPSPTTAPANLDKSKLSITVLNGSGKAGAASDMKDTLEQAGYTVSSTDNADNFDYAQTEIHVSSDDKDYLPLLKQDLSGNYTIGTADTNYSGTGAEVIVGKE